MAGRGKLTQSVPDHILGNVDRDMTPAIVYGDGVAYHLREDCAVAAPRSDHFLIAAAVHNFNLLQQFWGDVRPLLERS
jgi:hypothetical protein